MKEIDRHLKLRNKKVPLGDLEDIPNDFYKNIIIEYGYWLEGLICKEIHPITEDQKRFLSEFKKTRNKQLEDIIGNKFFVAMYLWKGKDWINLNSLNLEETTLKHKTKSRKPKTQPGSFSLDDSNQKKNEYFRNLKPNIKPKSDFPKLDPDKTYRWTDQGFQTREGHKIMSSKGYRNSKKG
ncbi:hypothetical protein OAC46_03370 [Flavobacteriaceae bacterium]|nr:hypothetical protein [Flavobacteriaceae bacterium]